MILFKIFLALTNIVIASGQFLECADQNDCLASNDICLENFCQCPKGKVHSSDGSECLDLKFAYDSPCVEDSQCAWMLGNHQCDNGKCRCAKGWTYFIGKCLKPSNVNHNCAGDGECFDGYDVLSMVCKDEVCKCNEGYYLRGNYDCRPISALEEYCSLNSDCQFENGVCENSLCVESKNVTTKILAEPNEELSESVHVTTAEISCKSMGDCSSLPNSICNLYVEKCLCQRGFRLINDKCVAELGTPSACTKDSECPIKYTRCLNGACYCRKSYFSVGGNMACQKPMTHDNLFCNNNERCYVFGSFGVCDNHTCTCMTSNPPNSDFVCDVNGCIIDDDCTKVVNSICVDKLCQCPKGFHLNQNYCLPDLGSNCTETAPCIYNNADCIKDVCSCKENFIQNDDSCLRLSQAIYGQCKIDDQCALIPNTKCIDNVCKCTLDHVDINGTCRLEKKMNDRCRSTSECLLFLGDQVVCRNGRCDCPVEKVSNANKDNCESSSSLLSVSYLIVVFLLTFNLMSY